MMECHQWQHVSSEVVVGWQGVPGWMPPCWWWDRFYWHPFSTWLLGITINIWCHPWLCIFIEHALVLMNSVLSPFVLQLRNRNVSVINSSKNKWQKCCFTALGMATATGSSANIPVPLLLLSFANKSGQISLGKPPLLCEPNLKETGLSHRRQSDWQLITIMETVISVCDSKYCNLSSLSSRNNWEMEIDVCRKRFYV